MKWCNKCILPDSRPGISINQNGTCNACSSHVLKAEAIDWVEREKQFKSLVQTVKTKSKGFDCIVPVSGGKDSTWQVVKCLEHGLRPLAVTWKTPARTKIGQDNLDNLVNLGVDHIDWQVNPLVEKKFMLKAFRKYGSTAIPMHMALFNIPLMLAIKLKIPLVVWGENSAFEYGSQNNESLGHRLNADWLKQFGVTHGTTAIDWIDTELSEKDLSSYFGPTDNEINGTDIHAIFLGHFFKWDVETSLKVALENGFKINAAPRTGIYNYADIDDDFISIHHWLKWFKFGITRSFDNLSLEIRNGRIKRSDAINTIKNLGEEKPIKDIQKLCSFLEISEKDFYGVAETFRNLDIWKKVDNAWRIEGFLIDDWSWD